MKTLATIILSFIAIVASLVLAVSTLCAFTGGFSGGGRSSFVLCALVSLAIVIAAIGAIGHLNRKRHG